ncbi:MAG: arginine repressor [Clostridia bacterium]|nr:arginine repressor [Clostridia bacterium]
MKNARQRKILELIEQYDIDTQETLIQRLSEAGIETTQTTISRDIRQLQLAKGITERGTYKYVLPELKKVGGAPVLSTALTDSIVKIEAAENVIVVKTLAGMANAIAVCIDSLEIEKLVGSVAGDDTVLLVIKTVKDAIEVEKNLKEAFSF